MTPRRLVIKALMHQEQAGYANLVLDAELKKCTPPMEARDVAFATRVFYTVLEYQPLLDYILNRFTKKSVAKLDPPIRAILRAGLAQARYMDVPLAASVNESVKLAKAFGKTSAAGMVNAVLRRSAEAVVLETDFKDPITRLEVYGCLSHTVAQLLYRQYGEDAFAIAAAFRNRTSSAVRVNVLNTTDTKLREELCREGHAVQDGPWPHALLVDFRGSPAAGEAFKQGAYHVQGLASQFAALCLQAKPGQRVLDLCAAPGGKSLTLAQEMNNSGELISGEMVPGRVHLMEKAFRRCGITCARAIQNDATVPNQKLGRFDRVLCDVPCSGLGVIAKKPDIRYKDLDGMENLCAIQQKILQNGADSLAESGRLVYSTCTINYEENQAQIERFLKSNPHFRVVSPVLTLPGMESGPMGTLFLPHKTRTDGFFVAILEKLST